MKVLSTLSMMQLIKWESSQCNQYKAKNVSWSVKINGNYINVKPIKDRSSPSMIHKYKAIRDGLTASRSVRLDMHVMDNEVSEDFKKKSTSIANSN